MLNCTIKTVLFDLDGTLLDTAHDLLAALNRTLQNHYKDPVPFTEFRYHIHGGSEKMVCYGFNIEATDPKFLSLKAEFLKNYKDHLVEKTRLFSGMEQVLDYLDEQDLQWGIVTNKPGWLTLPLLTQLKLNERSRCIIAGDTLKKRKPDPAPLYFACQQLNCLPEHTLYIGDTEMDIVAAKAANMRSIVALYGYKPKDSLPHLWKADFMVNTPVEIIDCLPKIMMK